MARFYVTTPIYYVNDVPHLGTAYTTIVADALRRFHRLRGDATRMLTGTDEHGLKLEREAQARGLSPAEFVTSMSDHFEATWPKLEVHADDFIRTTQPRHEKLAQELWRIIEARGDLYLGAYAGWYCVGCEEMKTEKELLPGNVCPLHPTLVVERLEEETYFFRLSKYAEPLLAYYEAHPDFIKPDTRRNEVLSFVRSGLRDLSVSRTSVRWGIPVPGHPEHVMYVWFDALTNYWSALQDTPEHKAFWSPESVVHLVGKDILRFHAVYWPALLLSAGIDLPKTIYAHGFLTFNGQKMGKSLRNAVDPLGIAEAFGQVCGSAEAGADVLRYQLLRAIAFGQDGDFDLGAMIERYNADLWKNLGNLLARTLGLCVKMTGSKVPAAGPPTALEVELLNETRRAVGRAREEWEAIAPHRALEATWALASAANTYVDRAAPWAEAKKEGGEARVGTILATLLEVLGVLSVMMWPVLPRKSDELRAQLGLEPVDDATRWPEGPETRAAGEALAPGPSLFPAVDDEGRTALLERLTPKLPGEPGPTAREATASAPVTPADAVTATTAAISHAQFSAVELRVGVVRSCERVPKKDKLLRLAVDVGEAEPRTIVAGLALSFQPQQLVGRRVIVVANLAPRDFGKGLVSHGMVLASGPSEKLVLATVDGEVEAGARLQ
jgi:methionyl-tRNA synthetase